MKKMVIGFLVFIVMMLGFTLNALAVGQALYIDTEYDISGQSYGNGYIPDVSNGAAHILLPLKTMDNAVDTLRVTPSFDISADSPFVYGNYEFNVNKGADGLFLVTLNLPLKSGRTNGTYPVTFRCAYQDSTGSQTQDFTVQVNITDGKDPGWVEPTPAPEPEIVAGQLSIDSRNLYPGMEKTYAQGYVPLVMDGRAYIILPLMGETYDGRVTLTADLGALTDSPFVYGNYSQTLYGGGCYVFGLEIPLIKERYNGTYPVRLQADYLNAAGAQASQVFTVHVTISDGKNPPDPNEPIRQEVEKPELFISACEVAPDTVGGEAEFNVSLTIENIGAIRARNVRLSYGSEAEGILPVETNAAMHLENIASEDSTAVSFALRTTKDVLAGSQPFFVTLDYVDLYGGIYTATRTFLVQVTQPANLSYDPVVPPKTIVAGETFSLPANVFNIGKSTLRNVTVTVEGAGLFPTSSVFLGDIAPGDAGYGEISIFAGQIDGGYGTTNALYTITYTDEAGIEQKKEVSFSIEIKELVIEPEEKHLEPTEQPAFQWWVTILVGFGIIAIIVAVIVVTKVLRISKMR